MLGLDKLVEQRIKESISNGDLDNSPYYGKPLVFEDFSGIPADLKMGFKVLRNAGILPEEMQLKKEISNLEELIATYTEKNDNDNLEKTKLALVNKISRYKIMMEKLKSSSTSSI